MPSGEFNVGFPFGFDATGRTRSVPIQDHVRDLVEQVLLTAPGERVNRPQFGSGLLGLVFEPGGSAVAAAVRAQVEASLQLWLADAIQVDGIVARADDSLLEVTVSYVVRATQERRVERVRTGSAL